MNKQFMETVICASYITPEVDNLITSTEVSGAAMESSDQSDAVVDQPLGAGNLAETGRTTRSKTRNTHGNKKCGVKSTINRTKPENCPAKAIKPTSQV